MDVDGDILGLILERIDSHVSLIRTAAVCKRWRRVIADAAFLCRFRSLHAPAVAGDYRNYSPLPYLLMGIGVAPTTSGRTGPLFLPSSPSMDASHFSLDFLPDGAESWTVVDSRGSLLLMDRAGDANVPFDFPDRVICEPLTRRYKRVSPPADFDESCHFWASFLVDGDADQAGGRIGLSNFRMLWMLYRNGVTHAAVFTAGGESGCLWSNKTIDHIMPRLELTRLLGRAGGSWYFHAEGRTLVMLDGSTSEFSSSMLPAIENWDFHTWSHNFFITDGRDGKPRIFTLFDNDMKVFARLDSDEWVLVKRVLLSEATHGLPGYQPFFFSHPLNILTRGAGFVILSPCLGAPWPFSVDLETVEVAPASADMGDMVFQ
ncbi:uncharacterized protein LOC133905454 isoform X2 [Phragmites australis]|nr:uncharacterized protein LOC133905454 isoform X2 [Phragmites australis]